MTKKGLWTRSLQLFFTSQQLQQLNIYFSDMENCQGSTRFIYSFFHFVNDYEKIVRCRRFKTQPNGELGRGKNRTINSIFVLRGRQFRLSIFFGIYCSIGSCEKLFQGTYARYLKKSQNYFLNTSSFLLFFFRVATVSRI